MYDMVKCPNGWDLAYGGIRRMVRTRTKRAFGIKGAREIYTLRGVFTNQF